MSKSRRFILVSTIAVAALLSLAACAPAVVHHPGGHHTGGSGSSATPSASSTPAPVAVAPPQVRVPLTCAQIAPAAQVTSVLGAPETLNTTDQTKGDPWLPSDLEPYAYVQDGALTCTYDTPAASDLTFYRAFIMPDASLALWNPYFAQFNAASQFNIQPSPFGANSSLNCESIYHVFDCELEMLNGTTWISLYGNSDEYPAETIAAAEAKFKPLFDTAVNAIKASTITEPLWSDPAATPVNISTTSSGLNTALNSAIGSPVTTELAQYGPTIEEATDDAVIPVHYYNFQDYVGNYAMNIDVLPAGSWAWSAVSSAASSRPNYTTVSGLGDEAFSYRVVGGEAPYEYAIVVSKGHNLFSVEVDTSTSADAAGALVVAKKAATAIAGLIG